MDTSVLGLALDAALERLAESGAGAPEVVCTRAPRDTGEEGTLRVVRQDRQGTRLTVARFSDRVREEA